MAALPRSICGRLLPGSRETSGHEDSDEYGGGSHTRRGGALGVMAERRTVSVRGLGTRGFSAFRAGPESIVPPPALGTGSGALRARSLCDAGGFDHAVVSRVSPRLFSGLV